MNTYMNKTPFILLLTLIISSCHFPRNVRTNTQSNFKGRYAKFLANGEKEIATNYYLMLSMTQDSNYVLRQFFPETMTLTEITTYDSPDREVKHGYYARYSDEGELITEGNYVKGKEEGYWLSNDCGEGKYENGKKQGEFIIKNKNSSIKAKYHYVNDHKEGDFVEFDSLGNIINEGIYKADTIFQQTNLKITESQFEMMPMYLAGCKEEGLSERIKCSQTNILQHILKNLRYPMDARNFGVEGIAIIQFVVDKDGSITDIHVIRGLCQSIKNEVIRVVKTFPKWQPGYKDGKPVSVQYLLPVKFKIEYLW